MPQSENEHYIFDKTDAKHHKYIFLRIKYLI